MSMPGMSGIVEATEAGSIVYTPPAIAVTFNITAQRTDDRIRETILNSRLVSRHPRTFDERTAGNAKPRLLDIIED